MRIFTLLRIVYFVWGSIRKGSDMAFLPDAYAEVDPMKTVHGLLGQRRRWINGSFFAFERVKQ